MSKHSKAFSWSKFIRLTLANFLILASVFLLVKTFFPIAKAEVGYFIDTNILRKEYRIKGDENKVMKSYLPKSFFDNGPRLAQMLQLPSIETISPVDGDFSIVIPKIAANAKIIPNVNAADDNEYLPKLRDGVAHVAGTLFPGEGGHIFLFAHSTDYIWNVGTYNALFYLLYKLEVSDEVDIFYRGKRHVYTVVGKEIVDPDQVQYLTRKTSDEFLTLQTCWPPGTTLKRLLVFARPTVE